MAKKIAASKCNWLLSFVEVVFGTLNEYGVRMYASWISKK